MLAVILEKSEPVDSRGLKIVSMPMLLPGRNEILIPALEQSRWLEDAQACHRISQARG
jgi:hypothetical protein